MLRRTAMLALAPLAAGALSLVPGGQAEAAQPVAGHVYSSPSGTPAGVTVRVRRDGRIVATLAKNECTPRVRSAIYRVRPDGSFRVSENYSFTHIVIKGRFTTRHRATGTYRVVVDPSPGDEAGCRTGVVDFIVRD